MIFGCQMMNGVQTALISYLLRIYSLPPTLRLKYNLRIIRSTSVRIVFV